MSNATSAIKRCVIQKSPKRTDAPAMQVQIQVNRSSIDHGRCLSAVHAAIGRRTLKTSLNRGHWPLQTKLVQAHVSEDTLRLQSVRGACLVLGMRHYSPIVDAVVSAAATCFTSQHWLSE